MSELNITLACKPEEPNTISNRGRFCIDWITMGGAGREAVWVQQPSQ